jgi:hypothetical protein
VRKTYNIDAGKSSTIGGKVWVSLIKVSHVFVSGFLSFQNYNTQMEKVRILTPSTPLRKFQITYREKRSIGMREEHGILWKPDHPVY